MKVYAWDPFLCVNSIGIWLGFRTAFTQGLDENLRKKITKSEFASYKASIRLCRPSAIELIDREPIAVVAVRVDATLRRSIRVIHEPNRPSEDGTEAHRLESIHHICIRMNNGRKLLSKEKEKKDPFAWDGGVVYAENDVMMWLEKRSEGG